jgi:hypothetical protein
MNEIAKRLRATQFDKDNMPRMKSERHLPVGLALEAADEIERLLAQVKQLHSMLDADQHWPGKES